MRSVRRTIAALIAASALSACSGDSITAPSRQIADPSLAKIGTPTTASTTCRAGYIAISGRCMLE